jgi:hypothetical protein
MAKIFLISHEIFLIYLPTMFFISLYEINCKRKPETSVAADPTFSIDAWESRM